MFMHRLPFICNLRIGEDCKTWNRCHFAVALWAVFHLPQLRGRHGPLADGVHKVSNIRDSPSVQLVVSLGKKAASVFKNEALPDKGEHIVANGFVPSDSIALID
jgi:hypothetical protein